MAGGYKEFYRGDGFELEEGGAFVTTITVPATNPAITAATLKIAENDTGGAAILTATSTGASPTVTITNNANNYVLAINVPSSATDALATTKRRLHYDLEVVEGGVTTKILYGMMPYRREPT